MKDWILETRGGLALVVVLKMVFLAVVAVVFWKAIEEAQSQEVLRRAKDRQECIRGGGAWQEGQVGIFRTESCVRSR